MLVVLSDTHAREDPRLSGRTAEAVESATELIHAGDFMTSDVLDAFESFGNLHAVYGNNDTPDVRRRLPPDRVFHWNDLRIAIVHGHEHTDTALSLFARQSNADLVVFGHSHAPGFHTDRVVPALNPGSHADPRRHRPAHAELEWDESTGLARGRLVDPSDGVFKRFTVEPRQ